VTNAKEEIVAKNIAAAAPAADESPTIEIVCPNGHRSVHNRDRVRRRNDAWCGSCGADLHCDADRLAGAGDLLDLRPDAGRSHPLKIAR
jgi:hypothetical protein